jgi:glucose/arabinose dehydrogenase
MVGGMRPIAFAILAVVLDGDARFAGAELVEVPALGVRLERGFRITQISDEKLANDIWCMTLNPRGEPVVSGPGYIATLRDTNGDGLLDQAVKFAETKGAMGLCFDKTGRQLLVMADGWLSEYRDNNLDRAADGPPRHILPFVSGEHGGHAIRLGPDGRWWVIGGNDAGIDERHQPKIGINGGVARLPSKPIAGAIVRVSADLKSSEVWADGFRNPYDFDFNERGDVFTYDSDCERDYFLPWYSPCRVYHVQAARHHGWRLRGYQRSFRVPDYLPETVPCLADLGRGSPTGVHVYKGAAFPPHYRGGLFVEDWTFGRIHYLPLVPQSPEMKFSSALAREKAGELLSFSFESSHPEFHPLYATRPEVFLEPIGTQGFAPTDVVETKDGALLVSIGGRKTRGAIFRIEAEKAASRAELPNLVRAEAPPPPEARGPRGRAGETRRLVSRRGERRCVRAVRAGKAGRNVPRRDRGSGEARGKPALFPR